MPEPVKQEISLKEEKQRGGIAFPLDYEDASSLKQSFFWIGQIQLSGGVAVIINSQIISSSVGIATHHTFYGTIGTLSLQCSNGQATITSSSNMDNSIVNVLIVF